VVDQSAQGLLNTRHRGALLVPASIAVTLLGAVALALIAALSGVVPPGTAAAIGALMLVCSVPLLRHVARNNPIDSLEPLITFSLIYFLVFGLGALHASIDPLAYGSLFTDPLPGLLMALAGLPLLLLGYYWLPQGSVRKLASWFPEWNMGPAIGTAVVFLVIGAVALAQLFRPGTYFFYAAITQSTTDLSVTGFFQGFFFIGLTMLSIIAFSTGRKSLRLTVLVLAVAATIALLPTARRYWLLLIAVAVVVPYHFYRRPIPVKAIVGTILALVFLLYPIGQLYRNASLDALQSGPSEVPRVAISMANSLSQMSPGEYVSFSMRAAFYRVNYALVLTRMEQVYPDQQDYLYGKTYLPGVTSLIPRYFWPDKPSFDYYNEFGRATGFLPSWDTTTVIFYSSVGELYLNFGILGLVIGMLVYGVLFKALYATVGESGRSPSAVLLYSLVFLDLVRVEGPLGPALPADFRWFAVGLVTLMLLGAVRRRRVPAQVLKT